MRLKALLLLVLTLLACGPASALERDKKLHLGVSFALGLAAVNQWPDNQPLAFGLAMVPGLLKEISDRGTTGFSGKDLAADAIGAALGVYTGGWLISRSHGATRVAYALAF